ncbi:hypothetical protein FRX54_03460 [Streptococcus sp. sy004]|nr:hypothetical protein FRX54_03460 [Streptococcus sp. sy004]
MTSDLQQTRFRLADFWSADQRYLVTKDGSCVDLVVDQKWPEHIYGDVVDLETRCLHYHSARDIVALRCFSCRRYYPCYHCHDTYEQHTYQAYSSQSEDEVVFCGACQIGMTALAYRQGKSVCPNCSAAFNPACKEHESIYFSD